MAPFAVFGVIGTVADYNYAYNTKCADLREVSRYLSPFDVHTITNFLFRFRSAAQKLQGMEASLATTKTKEAV